MTKEPLSDDAPATELFPQFQAELYRMVSEEVAGLTDEQLDWYSDRWEWSKWSIRRQVSHMGSFVPGWLFRRWGEQLFPQGTEHLGRLAETYPSPTKRWMDESQYWALPELLERIEASMQLAQRVLASETVRSMRRKEISAPGTTDFWALAASAHPTGFRRDPTDSSIIHLNLETTFRHLYYEFTTHMYNIHRLKRAQGLAATVEIPSEGYWVLPNWDRSEP